MKMQPLEAVPIISSYVEVQASLCQAVKEQYTVKHNDLPRHGSVSVEEGYWEFQRHGSGLKFIEVSSGCVIDVHVGIIDDPRGFDAWRLFWFLESKGINNLRHNGKVYDGLNEKTLDALLKDLDKSEIVSRKSRLGYEVYILNK